jgi:hypothetical protein
MVIIVGGMKLVLVLQVVTFLQPRFECCDSFIVLKQWFCEVVYIFFLSHFVVLVFDREEGWSAELIMGQLGKLKK